MIVGNMTVLFFFTVFQLFLEPESFIHIYLSLKVGFPSDGDIRDLWYKVYTVK